MKDEQPEPLGIEDRLTVLEVLVEESIWGPHLYNLDHRRAIAQSLYTRLEGNLRGHFFPPAVRAELFRFADSLAEIDSQPDPIKPALRPLIQPTQPGPSES